MKKLLITTICLICAGSIFALQCIQVTVTNDLPTTAAQAGVYGYTKFKAEGENVQVYSQIGDITIHDPTLTGTVAVAAITNSAAFTFVKYGKFANATPKTYLNAFKPGQEVTLWLTAEEALASATGTNIVQNVYLVVY